MPVFLCNQRTRTATGLVMTVIDESANTRTYRILVVDDNRDVADSLATLLQLWGFDVRTAYDGQEALQAAFEYRPDCLVSDIGLPGLDGYTLARRLRKEELFKTLPLIAITANADKTKTRAAGFDHHLVKPANPATVEELLRKLLAMDKRLERAEALVQQQGDVVKEARDIMKEVQGDVKEIKQELREVKEDVKDLKADIKQVKEKAAGE